MEVESTYIIDCWNNSFVGRILVKGEVYLIPCRIIVYICEPKFVVGHQNEIFKIEKVCKLVGDFVLAAPPIIITIVYILTKKKTTVANLDCSVWYKRVGAIVRIAKFSLVLLTKL